MTPLAWLLVGLGGAMAIIDWVAVAGGRRSVEHLAKPATLILLIAAAVALNPHHGGVRDWFVVGLVASVAGDVFLMGPPRWFVAGLGSFLVGHLAYIVGLALEQRSVALAAIGGAVVAAGVATLGRRIVGTVRGGDDPSLTGPVVIYVGALSIMVVVAWGSGLVLAIAGAVLFFASDATLAWDRFVRPLAQGRLAVIATYHLAQAGLVVALAHP